MRLQYGSRRLFDCCNKMNCGEYVDSRCVAVALGAASYRQRKIDGIQDELLLCGT